MSVHRYATKSGPRWKIRYRDAAHVARERGGFTSPKIAKAEEQKILEALRNQTYVSPSRGKITVQQQATNWLANNKAMTKPTSYRPIESAWRHHVQPRWGNVAVAHVSNSAINTWVSELSAGDPQAEPPVKPLSATLVRRCFGILAGILDDAVRDKNIAANPARDKANKVRLPRKRRKSHLYLTHEQVHALADAAAHPAIVLTLAYTGLRWGELTGLQVKHLDMLRRRITVERNIVVMPGGQRQDEGLKTGERRTVAFPPFLSEHLSRQCEHKSREDFVFTSEDGDILRPPNATYGWFASAVKRAGIPRITPHDLRHTTASLAVQANANVKAVQRMLGHASAAMTLDVYADLFDDELDRLSEALGKAAEAARTGSA